jgi:type I restriction enzyme M protein
VTRDKRGNGKRDRTGRTLFIDARQLGEMADRTHKVLSSDDIAKIADTYHAWRGEAGVGDYEGVAGFCYDAANGDIRSQSHVLTPGRYVRSGRRRGRRRAVRREN